MSGGEIAAAAVAGFGAGLELILGGGRSGVGLGGGSLPVLQARKMGNWPLAQVRPGVQCADACGWQGR